MKKHIIFLLFFILTFALSYRVIEDIDFGWHMRAGQYIAQNKAVPQRDLFTFSQPNYPYIYHSWLTELLLFESFNLFGVPGASALYAFALTITMFALYKTSTIISSNKISHILIALATLITYTVAGGRTRIFSLLCLSIIYYCFVKFYSSNSKIIWVIPFIMMLWANLHGSFPFGIAFLVITTLTYALFDKKHPKNKYKLKKVVQVTLISTLATLINPYFLRSWQNAMEVFLNSTTKISSINPDWQSIGAENSSSWILIAITAGIITLAYLLRKKETKVHIALTTLFLFLSLLTSRFLIGLVVFAIPLANLSLEEFGKRLNKTVKNSLPVRFSITAISCIIALIAIANILQANIAYRSSANYTKFLSSEAAVHNYPFWSLNANSFLNTNVKNGRIFNEGHWGGLMLLENPSKKIFYYSAMDNYIISGKPFAFEYLSIVNTHPGWENKIENYNINTIYLPPEYPLIKKLENDNKWEIIYKDNRAVIIIRK